MELEESIILNDIGEVEGQTMNPALDKAKGQGSGVLSRDVKLIQGKEKNGRQRCHQR